MVEAVSETSTTVLITGETSTGKELTARSLHQLSARNALPFIAVNCAALPENLLESTLFGHVKGAFTGAHENKQGYFARAASGTLFLDEIGDISPALQVRLLRVLQEREFEPVGSNKPQKTDARIITATNKDLLELVSQGKFREDLYYRLNVIKITLPTLAQRVEDIPFLVDHFITQFNQLHKKSIKGISPEALQHLQSYTWPGNIRELENSIERESERQASLGGSILGSTTLGNNREENKKQMIIEALKNNHSKISTAKALGIHKTTLFRKMKKYNIAF
jgi:transcriptional regulator with PAS, ATPase and Fis domain